jgi:hypothetical protein
VVGFPVVDDITACFFGADAVGSTVRTDRADRLTPATADMLVNAVGSYREAPRRCRITDMYIGVVVKSGCKPKQCVMRSIRDTTG